MRLRVATTVGLALAVCALAPAIASAKTTKPNPGPCRPAGAIAPRALATACQVAVQPDSLRGIVSKVGSVLASPITGAAGAVAGLGLSAIVSWVLGGAGSALHETATIIGKTTTPQLGNAWFSTTYGHMWGIATLLTLPFLCAAAVQALLHSDLALLVRVALGYLPLAMLAIGIAMPLTTNLLAASDAISNIIERAAGGAGAAFLAKTATAVGGLSAIDGSPFVAFLVGFLVAAGALVLWVELLLREVAVYVIVLSLPLVFAAFVWPARRVLAIRAVEMLVALILAKIAIVSVLALGAGALEHGTSSSSIASLLAGVALVTLGVFAPWALVKLMPFGELAASSAGPLRGQLDTAKQKITSPMADAGPDWAKEILTRMRNAATNHDSGPSEGAEAEAGRMAAMGAERTSDGVEGVDGGSTPDPLLGTARPPDGPNKPTAPGDPTAAGAPTSPANPGAPHDPTTPTNPTAPQPVPAEDAPDLHPPSGTERGPSPNFHGFEGERPIWQDKSATHTLSYESGEWSPTAEDDDPRPPAQEPEDGRL
jgi:hypothetical protein